jgi:hypothetical protein
VARKEHGEFSSNIDLIDTLPPGLYEAVFEEKTADLANADLVAGQWVMRCEARTLDNIRALGGNEPADERRFEAAARVSETNLGIYRTFAQPFVRAAISPPLAQWLRRWHPLRMQYEMLSDANPFMAPVAALAEQARKNRKSVANNNPFLAFQENMSRHIVSALDGWRNAAEAAAERTFLAIYGSPSLQAAAGIDPNAITPLRKAAKNPLHRQLLQMRIAELRSRIPCGGLREGLVRGALHIGMARGSFDERAFELVRRIRVAPDGMPRLSLQAYKALIREQYFMLLIDEEAALAAIPSLLPADAEERRKALAVLRDVITVRGELVGEASRRMEKVAQMFDTGPSPSVAPALQPTLEDSRPLPSSIVIVAQD